MLDILNIAAVDYLPPSFLFFILLLSLLSLKLCINASRFASDLREQHFSSVSRNYLSMLFLKKNISGSEMIISSEDKTWRIKNHSWQYMTISWLLCLLINEAFKVLQVNFGDLFAAI